MLEQIIKPLQKAPQGHPTIKPWNTPSEFPFNKIIR